MVPYKTLMNHFQGSLLETRLHRHKQIRIRDGGWHFKNMGSMKDIVFKMRASDHYNKRVENNIIPNLRNMMENERVDKGKKLSVVPIDNHPKWFRDNIDDFKHMLTEEK